MTALALPTEHASQVRTSPTTEQTSQAHARQSPFACDTKHKHKTSTKQAQKYRYQTLGTKQDRKI